MDYADLRMMHAGLAFASLAGFALRWSWMMSGSRLHRHRLTGILPHILDTMLLASAIWLAVGIGQLPFTQPWLTAKLVGLLAYIALGSLALKRATTYAGQVSAFLAATVVFAWIVSVARSKSAWGFLELVV